MNRTLIKRRGEDTLVLPHVPPLLDPLLDMTDAQKHDLTRKVMDARKYESKPWSKFKISAVLQPAASCLAHKPAWWVVTPDNCVLAFNNTLQCNDNEKLAEMLRANAHKHCTLQKFEMLFIPLSSWEIRQ